MHGLERAKEFGKTLTHFFKQMGEKMSQLTAVQAGAHALEIHRFKQNMIKLKRTLAQLQCVSQRRAQILFW